MYFLSFVFLSFCFLFLISSYFVFSFRKILFQASLVSYILSSISRPRIVGIDTQNLIDVLVLNPFVSIDPSDSFKYGFTFLISYLIHADYKVMFINLLSSLIISFSLYRFYILSYRYKSTHYWQAAVLVFSSVLFISLPLILVHTRQYLAFAILFPILLNYPASLSYNPYYYLILVIFSFFSHPLYFLSSLLLSYQRFKSYIKNIRVPYYRIFFLILLILSIPLLSKYYQTITGLLPGFYSYGVQETSISKFSILSLSTLFLLFTPALFQFFQISNNENDREITKIYSPLIFFILFVSFNLIFLEFTFPFLYSIGRVKAGIYPLCIPLLQILSQYRLKYSFLYSPLLLSCILFVYTVIIYYIRFNNVVHL